MLNIEELLNNQVNLDLTAEEKNYLYNLGANKCQIGDFAAAGKIYQLLTLLEANNPLYIKALAGCNQAQEEYLPANILYDAAYVLNPTDHDCLFYAANCLNKLDQLDVATEKLNQFIQISDNQLLIKRAKLLLTSIKQKTLNHE